MNIERLRSATRPARLNEWWADFRKWQQTSYVVAPLNNSVSQCPTCGTTFVGNFCPRCGQSARVRRFSVKTAILLFIDVWGLGNRGMFRTIRDLILRPGYMIRDYLRGMQMAYFPPFKMFFLLTTLSLLISSGFNIQGRNTLWTYNYDREEVAAKVNDLDVENISNKKFEKALTTTSQYTVMIVSLQDKYPNIASLMCLTLFSAFLFLFMRHCPALPDMRFIEMVVAMVYISNMYSIYNNFFDLLCLDVNKLLVYLLCLIPLKQLSGFSKRRLARAVMSALFLFILSVALLFVLCALLTMLFQ